MKTPQHIQVEIDEVLRNLDHGSIKKTAAKTKLERLKTLKLYL
jgi:hypothetical protein